MVGGEHSSHGTAKDSGERKRETTKGESDGLSCDIFASLVIAQPGEASTLAVHGKTASDLTRAEGPREGQIANRSP